MIVLSARGQERDKVTALDAGADDYVSKPFGAGELLARIRVALRHTAGASHEGDDAVFTVGELRVDLVRRQVFVGDKEMHLTPIEYKLLTTLVRHAGKVVTHQQLLREVWGPSHTEQAHYARVYMAHLRHKLRRAARRAICSRSPASAIDWRRNSPRPVRRIGEDRDRLLQDAVGSKDQRLRKREPECPGGLEIDDELEPRRLLDRQLPRICRAEDLADKGARAAVHRGCARPVREEAARLHELTGAVDRRHLGPTSQIHDPWKLGEDQGTSRNDDGLGPLGRGPREQASQRVAVLNGIGLDLRARIRGGGLKTHQFRATRRVRAGNHGHAREWTDLLQQAQPFARQFRRRIGDARCVGAGIVSSHGVGAEHDDQDRGCCLLRRLDRLVSRQTRHRP